MAYVTPAQVSPGVIAAPILRDALDDVGDGKDHPEILDAIIAVASQEVDGYLAGLFTVPFSDLVPAKVRAAALAFTIEGIYDHRQKELPKKWADVTTFWRKHLQAVGNREIPFDAALTKAFAPGAVIMEDASTNAQST